MRLTGETVARVAMFVPKGEGLEFRQSWEVTRMKGNPTGAAGRGTGRSGGESEIPVCTASLPLRMGRSGRRSRPGNRQRLRLSRAPPRRRREGDRRVQPRRLERSHAVRRTGARRAEPGGKPQKKSNKTRARLGAIAVNGAGEVYVFDGGGRGAYHRLMVFRPQSPGDSNTTNTPAKWWRAPRWGGRSRDSPVSDAAGNVYVVARQWGRNNRESTRPKPRPNNRKRAAPPSRSPASNTPKAGSRR